MRRARRLSAYLCLVALSACGGQAPSEEHPGAVEQELAVCPGATVLEGVDVSHWEPNVDWAEVKAGGRVFGFVKATQGTYYTDAELGANWKDMKAAGVIRGAYHFIDWSEDPLEQADYFVGALAKVGGLEPGDLPPVLDVEELQGTSPAIKKVLPFLERVHCLTGKRPLVYTRASYIDPMNPPSSIGGYPVWIAHYTSACPNVPKLWSDWTFWQYSESGKIAGVSSAVDLDRFDGTLSDLNAYISKANVAAPGCSGASGTGGAGGSGGSGGAGASGGATAPGGATGSGGTDPSSGGAAGAAGDPPGGGGSAAAPVGAGGGNSRIDDADGSVECATRGPSGAQGPQIWLWSGALALLCARRRSRWSSDERRRNTAA